MEMEQTVQWNQVHQRVEATQSCLAGSRLADVNLSNSSFDDVNFSAASIRNANLAGWRVQDVNFSGLQITNADLRGASIADCLTEGMTIDGVSVADLMAAYRAARPPE